MILLFALLLFIVVVLVALVTDTIARIAWQWYSVEQEKEWNQEK